MKKIFLSIILLLFFGYANACTQIVLWHSMAGNLGVILNQLIEDFNHSQNQYCLLSVYKGDYNQTLTSTVAAFRAHEQPDIVQVFEIGTATMVKPKGIIVPFYQLAQWSHVPMTKIDLLPVIYHYYADAQGRLLAMPLNVSVPVMFYNKDAFIKAGLDPNIPPKTWEQLHDDAQTLIRAGFRCGFTTGWPSWIMLENFSAWHNLPFATQKNGFLDRLPKVLFNNAIVLQHVAALAKWQKENIFHYGGRADNAMSLFTSSYCPILFESSGSIPDLTTQVNFKVGVGFMPYWSSVQQSCNMNGEGNLMFFQKNSPEHSMIAARRTRSRGAEHTMKYVSTETSGQQSCNMNGEGDIPQNAAIGGAALWSLSGHSPKVYQGIMAFYLFLLKPKVSLEWQQKTGYLPLTLSAYQLGITNRFYQEHPSFEIAVKELLNKVPTENSMGFRLGNYMRIREINEQYLEAIWSGKLSAKTGLAMAEKDDNRLLHEFFQNTSIK